MELRGNKAFITALTDEMHRIDARTEICIEELQSIIYKHKPSPDDMTKIKKVIRILQNSKEK